MIDLTRGKILKTLSILLVSAALFLGNNSCQTSGPQLTEKIEVWTIDTDGPFGQGRPSLQRKTLPANSINFPCHEFFHVLSSPVEECTGDGDHPEECEKKGVCHIFLDMPGAKGFIAHSVEDVEAVWDHIFKLKTECKKWK